MENTFNSTTNESSAQDSMFSSLDAHFNEAQAIKLYRQLPAPWQDKLEAAMEFMWLRARLDLPTCSSLADLLRLSGMPDTYRQVCLDLYREITLANDVNVGFSDHPTDIGKDRENLRKARLFQVVRFFDEQQEYVQTSPEESTDSLVPF